MLTNTYTEVYNDILYFKSLYPDSIMNIYRHVSDYCDKLEHNGSLMYDEFPDKERIRLMARQIHNNLMTEMMNTSEPYINQNGRPYAELIEILILNEFIHRRVRRRAFS